jgi:broad specificity phosphatase PhoE
MVTRLTFICHGATAATRGAVFPADEPLEAESLARAAGLAAAVSERAAAFTSPMLRARQTAQAAGLTAQIADDLRDIDMGTWVGRTLDEVETADPAGLGAWLGDPQAAPHGGETLTALLARVGSWLDGLGDRGGYVAAITHPAVIRAAILHALGAPAAGFWHLDVAPLSLVRMNGDGRRWTLRAMGERPAAS